MAGGELIEPEDFEPLVDGAERQHGTAESSTGFSKATKISGAPSAIRSSSATSIASK